MIYLKSLCKNLVATIMAILSYISLLKMIAALNYLIKNLFLANILIMRFFNSLDLFIFGYIRSFQKIEYIMQGLICKHIALSFFYITFKLLLLRILLNRLLLTLSYIILIAISIAIQSFFLWS